MQIYLVAETDLASELVQDGLLVRFYHLKIILTIGTCPCCSSCSGLGNRVDVAHDTNFVKREDPHIFGSWQPKFFFRSSRRIFGLKYIER